MYLSYCGRFKTKNTLANWEKSKLIYTLKSNNENDQQMDELTKLRRKILELERNERLFKETEKTGKIGGWQFDPVTLKQTWTDEVFRILEIDLEHSAPKVPQGLEFIHPDYRPMAEKAVQRVMEQGEPYNQEWMVTTARGDKKWVHAVCDSKKKNGKVVTISGSFQDITSKKIVEEELKKSEERLRVVFDNSPFPVAVVDEKDQRILFWSKSAIQLFGHNPKTTEEWYELAYPNPEYRKQVIERWKPFLEIAQNSAKAINTGEYQIHCKNGEVKICELYAQFIPGSLIVTLNDITERKKAEELLKSQNQQLLANEQQLKASNQQLCASEQQLLAANQQLQANEQQLRAAVQQLQAGELQLLATNQQLRASETELRNSKEQAERYLNIAAEIILSLDSEGNITLLNDSGYQLLGYNNGALTGKEWLNICIPEEEAGSVRDVFSQIIKGEVENVANYESNIITKSGEIKTILWHNTVLKDKNGKITGTLSSGEDITERKNTERQIVEAKEIAEKSEKYLENIINNLADPIFVKDEESKLLVINDAFCQLFGLNKENILGKTLAEDVSPAERESFLRIDKLVLNSGKENISEESLTVRDSQTKTISTKKSRFLDEKGRKFLIGIIRDITDRKIAESLLIEAKEKAEEADRLKSAFLANMSHEIRTPMNGILGFANLLKKPNLTGEEQQKYIEIIQKSGDRMLNTVNDIIDISRIESNLVELAVSEVNINEQLKYLHSFFIPEAAKKGIQLIFKNGISEKNIKLKTDLEKFNSIITNLIKNAIKFTNQGFIELGYNIKNKNGSAEIEFYVKDSGIGIPKNKQIGIFNRFVQVDIEDKQAKQGSGLGLAISKAYAEMLGGKIWLDSEVGKGSTFYFTIAYNSGSESKTITINDSQLQKGYPISRRLNILVVEDDETSKYLISIMVENFAKKIITVNSGLEAVEVCRNNADIDLILMDIQFSDMNGYEATRQIRRFNKDVVILAQTAFALTGDKEKAINMGCNDYISKPINQSELYEMIQKYLMN
jgi:PAS domain S-box-containing protein